MSQARSYRVRKMNPAVLLSRISRTGEKYYAANFAFQGDS